MNWLVLIKISFLIQTRRDEQIFRCFSNSRYQKVEAVGEEMTAYSTFFWRNDDVIMRCSTCDCDAVARRARCYCRRVVRDGGVASLATYFNHFLRYLVSSHYIPHTMPHQIILHHLNNSRSDRICTFISLLPARYSLRKANSI